MLTPNQKITGYLPADDGLKKALTGADVVLIPAGIPRTPTEPLTQAKACSQIARKARHDP